MGTEKTVIKYSKGKSGLGGITRKKAAIVRWSLSWHILGQHTAAMQDVTGKKEKHDKRIAHEETKPASMSHYESHVSALVSHLTTTMTNPFSVETHPPVLIKIRFACTRGTEIPNKNY